MEQSTTHEFNLKSGLFTQPRKLIITPDFIEFETSALLSNRTTKIENSSFNDVKYLVESIVWYKFRVGFSFQIQVKYNSDKILAIKFVRYFWMNKEYSQVYSDISRHIGKYFLSNKINEAISKLDELGSLEISGVKITNEAFSFENSNENIAWDNVGLKEYYEYFAIFDKANPKIHKRFTFDEWNAEVLFNVMMRLVRRSNPDKY